MEVRTPPAVVAAWPTGARTEPSQQPDRPDGKEPA